MQSPFLLRHKSFNTPEYAKVENAFLPKVKMYPQMCPIFDLCRKTIISYLCKQNNAFFVEKQNSRAPIGALLLICNLKLCLADGVHVADEVKHLVAEAPFVKS